MGKKSRAKEVWAEGDIQADVLDVQRAVVDVSRWPAFLPYVKEARRLKDVDPQGGAFNYVRLGGLPFVGGRDYVLHVFHGGVVTEPSKGTFNTQWSAVQGHVPVREDAARVYLNQGSWTVTPLGPGKCHAVYRFAVDPGQWIPDFAADIANAQATEGTFEGMAKEAARLGAARAQAVAPH